MIIASGTVLADSAWDGLRSVYRFPPVFAVVSAILVVLAYCAVVLVLNAGSGVLPHKAAEKFRIVLFAGPALFLLLVGLVIPGVRTFILSFHGNKADNAPWVGLENYRWIFGTRDGFITVRNSLLWVVIVPVMATVIGLTIAVLVDRMKGESMAKALIFLPNVISLAGAGIVWKFVYDYNSPKEEQIGILNQILVGMGFSPVRFLQDNLPWNNLFLMFVMVWVQAGFATVVLSAAVKGVPDDIMEAARTDGCTERQVFWKILLPSVRPTIIVVLTTVAIASLKAFDVVKSMTNGFFESDVVASAMMSQTFSFGAYGYGAALAVVLFIAVVPIMWFNIRSYRNEQATR